MATYAGQATLHCNTGTNTSAHVHRVEAINQPHLTSGGPSSESDRPFELAAGDTIDLHAESRAYSGAPQNSELRVWLLVYEDNTGVEAMPLTLVMDIASFEVGQQYRGSTTFTAPESGTYRVTLRARYDDDGSSVAGGYDGNTDGSWSRQGSTPLWTNQPTWHQGYVRSGVTINAVNPDNDIAFDGPPSPFAWPDTVRLQVQASHGIVTNTSNSNLNFNTTDGNGDPVLSGTVAMNDTTIWQDNGGTSQLDSSHPTSFGLNFKPADSTLSGRPTVHFEGVPASWVLGATDGGAQTTKSVEISRDTYLSWNGSINVDHHLQVNDNVFDQSSSQINRLISDLGFVTFTLTNARGELTSGVTCDEVLYDSSNLVAPAINQSVATQADGRPSTMVSWDSQLPGGAWIHEVTITAPSGVIGQEVSPTETWTLLAINPAYSILIGAGAATEGADGDHWSPGDDLLVGAAIFNGGTFNLETLDISPSPSVLIGRFRQDLGTAEYLDSNYEWQTLTAVNSAYNHELSQSPSDPRVHITTVPGSATAAWTVPTLDLFVLGIAYVNGTPYRNFTPRSVLAKHRPHSVPVKPEIDPLALALGGVISYR